PVLDMIMDTSARLCDAKVIYVMRVHAGKCHLIASKGAPPQHVELLQRNPISPGRGTVNGRCLLERRTIHIPDVLADPEFTWTESQRVANLRTALCVPLLRRGEVIGTISLHAAAGVVNPFTAAQIALIETFADQAVIAIENARLFEAEQTRTRELTE